MRAELNNRLTELTSQLEAYNSQENNPDFQKILSLLISVSILFSRTIEKRQEEERMASNERRTQSTNELAGTYKNFTIGTIFIVTQAAVTIGGSLVAPHLGIAKNLLPTVLQGTSQAIGSAKGLMDESTRGNQTILQHTIEKTKMFGDDLGRDAQRSQSHISELLGLRKQMDNESHNTANKMT